MRYPEEKIREAILSPDDIVRRRALRYFKLYRRDDPSIMPLVIQAVETYGRGDERLSFIGGAVGLAQSPESVDWLLRELNDPEALRGRNYRLNLNQVLAAADIELLRARAGDVFLAQGLFKEQWESIERRLEMATWDEERCWSEAEDFCEAGADEPYITNLDWPWAEDLAKTLGRKLDRTRTLFLRTLEEEPSEMDDMALGWMELFAVQVAKAARLEESIPLLCRKMHVDSDLLPDWAARALASIGTPAVLDQLEQEMPEADDTFRMHSTVVLERFPSDRSVEICLRRLPVETDEDIACELCYAVLEHFDDRGIDEARRLLATRGVDFLSADVRINLLETCALTGWRFPEYEEWIAEDRLALKEQRGSLASIPKKLGPLLPWMGELPNELDSAVEPVRVDVGQPVTQIVRQGPKVGRNEKCPCGSGKKFKNCCLGRTVEAER